MRTMLLVHGAWHASWCWAPVTEHLLALGVPSVAVDLPGNAVTAYGSDPSPAATVTVREATDHLIARLRTAGRGRPCVLVAHGQGGVVATAAAERAPDLVDHLIYVSAYVPIAVSVDELFAGPGNAGERISALLTADPAAVGALRINPDDPACRAGLREALYADVDRITATAATLLLSTDAPLGYTTGRVAVTPERYGRVPHSYVLCTADRAIPEPLQRRLIRDIDAVSDAATRVVTLDSGHSPFLSRPEELAQALVTLSASSPRCVPA